MKYQGDALERRIFIDAIARHMPLDRAAAEVFSRLALEETEKEALLSAFMLRVVDEVQASRDREFAELRHLMSEG